MDTDSLRKILNFEEQKGYHDSAVVGGLDKFLGRWLSQGAGAIADPRLMLRLRRLLKPGYASLTAEKRLAWVKSLLEILAEVDGAAKQPAQPKTPTAPKRRTTVRTPPVRATASQSLDAPITVINGVGPAVATKFAKLGVITVRDLLYFFPHRYMDYSQHKTISQLKEGSEETVIANVWQAHESRLGGRRGTEAIVGDETGNCRVVWFNNPYVAKKLTTNMRIVISGRVSIFNGRPVFESPEWEPAEEQELLHTGRLVPLYPLTQGLFPRQVRKLLKNTVDTRAGKVSDFLSDDLKERCKLLDLPAALVQAHFPDDNAAQVQARFRLAFDELFLLQLGVLDRKRDWQQTQPGHALHVEKKLLEAFLGSLPFALTKAQQKSLKEILADLERALPMSRLLQGDVGSGKTVVAVAALLVAVASGYQGALMAPTEILAEQHFRSLRNLLSGGGNAEEDGYVFSCSGILSRPLKLAMLIGDVSQVKKTGLQQQIASGEVDIVIGTHAIIQKEVHFKKLGVAVVDEQHRFGVEQRSALRQKGFNPHILVMTATPIPRSLALTLYGDLDLSVIDELPPGRQSIKTKWLKPEQRHSAYNFIRREVTAGHQAFIICPFVEESESVAAKAAVAEYDRLVDGVFPDLKLGLLHGRMSATEKDDVMRRFHSGELHILVSTPVVEVGIDIPNATVMMVESADRFGLAQLHQFRGRVGRGKAQSYCMLMAENPSELGQKRLDLIEKTQDGFVLAEEDLKIRGPGEFFGTRQSGLPDLRMAKLSDIGLLEMARREAQKLFAADSGLKKTENLPLAEELARIWPKEGSEIS